MKNKKTELVFVLDRSGSMHGMEGDTIGGFNALLAKQKTEGGESCVTTVLFDDNYEILHDRIDAKAIRPITEKEYYARGSTALLDAIGKTILKIQKALEQTDAEYRSGKVLFVITTDGMENSSREFTYEKIRSMIKRCKKEDGWEFIFLGADIDAVGTASRVGIDASRAVDVIKDKRGLDLQFSTVARVASSYTACADAPMREDLLEIIKEDTHKRRKV